MRLRLAHQIFAGLKQGKAVGSMTALALGAVLWTAAPAGAAITTSFTGATGGEWSDPLNWDNGLPTSADTVNLQSKTVNIDSYAAVLSQFNAGGTVNINTDGSLTGSGAYSLRYVTTINVNNGGELVMPNNLIRTTVNVNAGGTASGAYGIPQAESKTLSVDGTWSPRGTTIASGTSFAVGSGTYTGVVDLGATGDIILDVYGDGSNEYFAVGGSSTSTKLIIDTLGGTIHLRTQSGYTPLVGDSFDLWNNTNTNPDPSLTMHVGDGSNITLDGYTLDLTQWASDGIVTVNGVTGVPEPASLGLMGLGGLLLLRRRRWD